MLPNFYLSFSGRFYQILLNLNLLIPIYMYHYFDTFTAAAYLCHNEQIYGKNFTVGLYFLVNINNFSLNGSKFPESCYYKNIWFIAI